MTMIEKWKQRSELSIHYFEKKISFTEVLGVIVLKAETMSIIMLKMVFGQPAKYVVICKFYHIQLPLFIISLSLSLSLMLTIFPETANRR